MAQILKHSGSWGYRISYYDKFGKRKFLNKFGFKRKSDASEAAHELELKKKSTNLEKREFTTFSDYYNSWIKTYKLGKYSRNTELRYIAFGKSIYNYFGNTLLKDVTKADYQKFMDQYAKGRSKASVRRVNGYVSTVLNDAIDEQIINRDFTHNVLITGTEPKSASLKYLELDEASKLKKYAYERLSLKSISFYEILFALATGCRYGEIVGLTWPDIDFKSKTVSINKTYDYVTRSGFKPTKTKSSVRNISIDTQTVELLQQLKQEQIKTFFRQGFRNEKQLVFLNNRHYIVTNNGANKVLESALKSPEVNAKNIITFHGLRHTHASILISQGVGVDYIAERLGHADTSITLRVYVHLLKDKRDKDNQKALKAISEI